MRIRLLSAIAVACGSLVLSLAGCSKSADAVKAARAAHESGQEDPDLASARARARAIKAAAVVPGDNELVSAVADDSTPSTDTGPQYDLRFRLLARPEVAQPLQIEIVAVPAADTQFVRLQLSVQPGEGISVTGAASFDDRDMPTGERVRHTINVVPAQSGVLQLFVTTVAVTDKTTLMRQYAIPLIAFGAQPASAPN